MKRLSSGWGTLLFFLVTLLVLCVISRMAAPKDTVASASLSGRAVVLMYHHLLPEAKVGKYAGNSIVTTAEAFEQQLDWLQENGFVTITPSQLAASLCGDAGLPERAVLITFDDGYLSNAELAYPLLKERGMCATVFVVTGHTAETRQTFKTDLVQMMDRQTMLDTADVFTYASHTHDLHTIAGKGSSTLTVSANKTVAGDLEESLAFLRNIPGADLTVFSYPYGLRTENTEKMLTEAGIQLAFIASGGVVTPDSDRLALPRCPVDSSVSMKTFQGYFSGILSATS